MSFLNRWVPGMAGAVFVSEQLYLDAPHRSKGPFGAP